MRKLIGGLLLSALMVASARAEDKPALNGACPVCLYEMQKVMPGKAEHKAAYGGKTYLFPGPDQLAMFNKSPAKYAPILGGDCIVCWASANVRMPGKPEFSAKHNGHLFLFPSQKELDVFKADPKKYETADMPFGDYCAVCLLDGRKVVKGKSEFTSTYDGMRYLFPEAGAKDKFDKDPAKYAPALSGYCVVCLKNADKLVPGKINYGLFYDGRSFLLPAEEVRKKFMEDPAKYANADLAAEGNCVVCQKEADKAVAGSKEHQVVYKGMLYRFPGAEQKKMFLSNPSKYAVSSPFESK